MTTASFPEAMLTCPNCRQTLIRCQNEFGNFWHCADCEGTAVTVSLLRKFVHRDTMNALWQGSRQYDRPRRRDCPGCSNRMEEVPLATPSGDYPIDVCDRCQFIWLDRGEWDALPHAPVETVAEDPVRQAPMELREKIALERLRKVESEMESYDSPGPDVWWQWVPTLLACQSKKGSPAWGASKHGRHGGSL